MEKLLLKYIDGECTEEEKVKVAAWLDADPKHMKEYLALRKLNDISIWQTDSSIAVYKKKKGCGLKLNKATMFELLKIAAIFVIAFIAVRFFAPGDGFKDELVMQTLHVPAGQRAELTLQDGTKVWLNAKTTLTFPTQFSDEVREVKLDGEGFFEVARNEHTPFIVNAQQYDVKVLGTKFNLIAYSQDAGFETALLEGAVEVMKHSKRKGIVLKPNEQALLEDGQLIVSSIVNRDRFLWRKGIISFDNATFAELAHKLELYFDRDIEIRNPEMLNYKYSGKFRMKDGVEHIIRVLQLNHAFSYQIDEEQNKIIID